MRTDPNYPANKATALKYLPPNIPEADRDTIAGIVADAMPKSMSEATTLKLVTIAQRAYRLGAK